MKVDPRSIPYDVTHRTDSSTQTGINAPDARQGSKNAAPVETGGKSADTVVHFSETSKSAHAVRESIAAAPDVREEKVTALKEAIDANQYRIDHAAVADKLVDTLLDDI